MSFDEAQSRCAAAVALSWRAYVHGAQIGVTTRLNTAETAENSRLITEHRRTGFLRTESPCTAWCGAEEGRGDSVVSLVDLCYRNLPWTTRAIFILADFGERAHRPAGSVELLAACGNVSLAVGLPISPRRLLRRSSLRMMASAISRMDLRRWRLSRCMAL